MSVVRAAMTQTCNAYRPMPGSMDELSALRDRLDDIRQANVDHHLALIAAAADWHNISYLYHNMCQ